MAGGGRIGLPPDVDLSRPEVQSAPRTGDLYWASDSTSGSYDISLTKDLLEHPGDLPTTSKYTTMNGLIYLVSGALLIVWPGSHRCAPRTGHSGRDTEKY